jgi:polysaccharide export outer membrane protein
VPAGPNAVSPLTPLGPGDSVTMHVFGQPDMDTVLGVADDGSIRIPLAGAIPVGGLSAESAARKVEKAFKDGGFFIDPHVTLTVTQSLSQRVSVLGEVRTPGRYPVDAKTNIIDLLAQAGGETEFASDTVYVLRTDAAGSVKRYPVNLKGLARFRCPRLRRSCCAPGIRSTCRAPSSSSFLAKCRSRACTSSNPT